MLSAVQRGPEINRNQTNDGARPEVSFQQFAEKLQKEVQQEDHQVMQSDKSEGNTVDKDGKGNAGGGTSQRKRRKQNEKEDEKQKAKSTSMFDVSI